MHPQENETGSEALEVTSSTWSGWLVNGLRSAWQNSINALCSDNLPAWVHEREQQILDNYREFLQDRRANVLDENRKKGGWKGFAGAYIGSNRILSIEGTCSTLWTVLREDPQFRELEERDKQQAHTVFLYFADKLGLFPAAS